MNKYIASVCFLTVFFSVIMLIIPKGKINKTLKFIFGILFAVIIISPILSIDKNNLFEGYTENTFEVFGEENFINKIIEERVKKLEEKCLKILGKKGVENGKIKIEYQADELGNIKVEKVFINLKNAVIKTDNGHIDISEDLKKEISKALNISESLIVYE